MLNWYYKYLNSDEEKFVIGAVSTPSIPHLTFAEVRDQLIIPYLKTKGVYFPRKLTYERAKNAPINTQIVEASSIKPFIVKNGEQYSTHTGQKIKHALADWQDKNLEVLSSSSKQETITKHNEITCLNEISSLTDLFSLWKAAHIEDKDYSGNTHPLINRTNFVEDGFIDIEEYMKTSPKILFILKEANVIHDGQVDETGKYTVYRSSLEWIHEEMSRGVSHKILVTLDMINTAIRKLLFNDDNIVSNLNQVAYMNINKRGGSSKTKINSLRQYGKKYKSFIRRQIEILAPDYVVCCGSGCLGCISEVMGFKYISKGDYFISSGMLFIKAMHPSSWKSSSYEITEDFIRRFTIALSYKMASSFIVKTDK